MTETMSAKEYRKQIIQPALDAEGDDVQFANMVKPQEKIKPPTEHEIQSNILDRLNFLKNAFFWRENSGAFALEHNGKKRFFRAGVVGIADIMGVWEGVPVAIEVKREKTKKNVSLVQKAFLQRFRDCGGIGIVCFDDGLVVQQLEEAKLKLLK